jgi:hypothetical protein
MEFATLDALNVLLSSFDTNAEILSQLFRLLTIWPAPGPLFDPGVGPVEPRVDRSYDLYRCWLSICRRSNSIRIPFEITRCVP